MTGPVEREEWRVTGDPGDRFPYYDFVFGSPTRLAHGQDTDPETAARQFIERVQAHPPWAAGPHLHKRTVTETPWEQVL